MGNWKYAPSWATHHAFDDPTCFGDEPTGRWWEHRPLRYPKKCFWENPNASTESQPSGETMPKGYNWMFSVETRPTDILPIIVCLCGSTRFWREFQRASLRETMEGKIVLSIGAASGTDDEHFGNLPQEEYDRVKEMLDDLHLHKIDLADEVLVISENGYIGSSTRREIDYALSLNKRIRWMEDSAQETYHGHAARQQAF